MAYHSVDYVENLERELTEGCAKLAAAMRGVELSADEVERAGRVGPHLRIDASAIRLAADQLAASLKEIKAHLGKG